jgi:predicted nucleic acid-binding protein
VAQRKRFNLVVGDSSALIALATCRALSFLDSLAATVRVPKQVLHEVLVEHKPQAQILSPYLEGKVQSVDLEKFVIEAGSLGRGELEAMALFKQLAADVLLIDDSRARKIARLNKIPIIGSLGILLLAKQEKLTPEVRPFVEALRRSELFFGEPLLCEVLRLAGEEC